MTNSCQFITRPEYFPFLGRFFPGHSYLNSGLLNYFTNLSDDLKNQKLLDRNRCLYD